MTDPVCENPNYSGSDTNAGETRLACHESEDETPEEPTYKVRVGIFFDGTGNNRTNTQVQRGGAPLIALKDSYDNDYSNIAKLERFWSDAVEPDHSFSLYVEGIGTVNRGSDDPDGLAFGTGPTGVVARVRRAIRETIRRIVALPTNQQLEYVHLDTFGFSRGAAAARYCIHHALQNNHLKSELESQGFTVGNVSVKFVGLYDTVASYGIAHSNDTADLNLNAIRSAERVVQLAAAEEHRKNFRLTNINSARNGREIFLPGVHSDVGGGYNDRADEVDLQILDLDVAWLNSQEEQAFRRERQWLMQMGWYRASEIQAVSFTNELKVTRRNIRNLYSRIPLQLMARFARESGVNFSSRLGIAHSVPQALREVENAIDEYIASHDNSNPIHWFENTSDMMRGLRHDYLHFSSSYGGTNQPQWTGDNPVTGRRRRIIQNG